MPFKRNPEGVLPPPSEDEPFDLGNWLGRWQAFGFVAGRCSAANIECLREIRDKKLYRSGSRTWPLFCSRYLGLSRPQADRFIQYLDEFGPNYFHLTQLVPVSPQSYRLIAHAVRDDGILRQGTRIELTPQNAGSIRRAVRELRFQACTDARSPARIFHPLETAPRSAARPQGAAGAHRPPRRPPRSSGPLARRPGPARTRAPG